MKKSLLNIIALFTFHFSLFTFHANAASGPLLYGMTKGGGINSIGNIFKIYSDGSSFGSIYSFNTATGCTPVGSLLQAYSNSFFYGMTQSGGANNKGVIFKFNPSNNAYNVIINFNNTNGSAPTGNLIQATNGLIYGMTPMGGINNKGVLFSLDPASNNYTVLINFDSLNGRYPNGSLIQSATGLLYGMTEQGGTNNYGTIDRKSTRL